MATWPRGVPGHAWLLQNTAGLPATQSNGEATDLPLPLVGHVAVDGLPLTPQGTYYH